MNDLGQASPPAIKQYLRFAQSQGLDTAALLQQAGISSADLAQENQRIEGEKLQALIANLLVQTDCPVLGLLSGDFVESGSYSVLGLIILSCATLGEAIMRIAPFEKLVGDMGTTTLHNQGDELYLRWRTRYPDPNVRAQMVDNVFASWIAYARWLSDAPDESPVRVELERQAPAAQYLDAYQQRWHCPVRFAMPHNQIVIHKSLLLRPLRQPNTELRHALEAHAKSKLASLAPAPSFTQQVQQILQHLLHNGSASQTQLAAHLHLSLRTLQRKLTQEKLSYQQILDQERQVLAQHWLKENRFSIEEIASKLGFAETTSFYRSFKKWTGVTPAQFKNAPSQNDCPTEK